jgi:hypothetical protein
MVKSSSTYTLVWLLAKGPVWQWRPLHTTMKHHARVAFKA